MIAGMLAGCSGDGEENSQSSVDTYRQKMREELDIKLTQLAVVSGTVGLKYTSSCENKAGELNHKRGLISGRFGRQVAEGGMSTVCQRE